MTKNFMLGIDPSSKFDAGDVLNYVPFSANTDFQGVYLEKLSNIRNAETKLTLSSSSESQAFNLLNKLSVDLKNLGVQMNIPGKHVVNTDKLVENSVLFDLFCSGNGLLDENHELFLQPLLNLKCPVFLFPHNHKKINHLLLLFDGTASSMAVIKKGLKLFGEKLSGSSVSVLALHDDDVKQEYNEHLIVSFLLSKFTDVGILAIQKDNLNKEMHRILKNNEGIMVFTGHYGAEIIIGSELKNYIRTFNNPLFFTD